MKYKIYSSINEWKESDNYIIFKYFKNKEIFFKNLFNTKQNYRELEYERFEHDSTIVSSIKFAYLFFSDNDFNYKLELSLDYDALMKDMAIEECLYQLSMTSKHDDQIYESIESSIKDDELLDDTLISLISEIKEKNNL